jgi:hypothetical protein
MMKYLSKLLLTFVFALLQCVAPLAHAHVDGQHSGILPPSLSAQSHAEHMSINSTSTVKEYESPAITLSHEFQRDHQCAIAQPAQANIFNILSLSDEKHLTVATPAIFVLSPYKKSHPQAPPALS